MNLRNHKIQKFISGLLIIAFIFPATILFAPKKAEAIPVVDFLVGIFTGSTAASSGVTATSQTLDTATNLKRFAREVTQEILRAIARRFLQQMTKSTINWINSGFHGKPLFVENPDSFFKDIAKYEVRNFVDMVGYNSLRYPFGREGALNAIYTFKTSAEDRLAYSLSGYINDPVYLESFRNDFTVGGWSGFLINTQYPQNNSFGFRLEAADYLASRIQNSQNKIDQTLDRGSGFLSPQMCATNPNYNNLTNPWNPPAYEAPESFWNPPAGPPEAVAAYYTQYNEMISGDRASWEKNVGCPPFPDGSPGLIATTPGSVVATQITNAMGSQFRQSELAAAMGNSISQIVDALINKFMSDGLNALASKVNRQTDPDTWDYLGNSLGTVQPYNSTSWDAGPDEIVTVASLKTAIEKGIADTTTELNLINELVKVQALTWPEIRKLDYCLPGPDLGWEERLLKETQRNSQKLYEKESDSSPERAAVATGVLHQLEYAIKIFEDWTQHQVISALPNATLFLDKIRGLPNLHMDSTHLQDEKWVTNRILARLNSIKTKLEALTSEPLPGTAGERTLVSLKKQYEAVYQEASNLYSVEDMRNKLNVARDELVEIVQLTGQCKNERVSAGWDLNYENGRGLSAYQPPPIPKAPSSLVSEITTIDQIAGRERELFCDKALVSGFTHGERENPFSKLFQAVPEVAYIFKNPTDPEGIPPYRNLPMINAEDVFSWTGSWYQFGFGGGSIDINLACSVIWRSNLSDYKGTISGISVVGENFAGGAGSGGGVCSNPAAFNESQVTQGQNTWNPPEETQVIGYLDRIFNNGWWPRVSTDGKYVAYGNYGGSWVTDLATKKTYDLSNPPGLTPGARCISGYFIEGSNKISVWCDHSEIRDANGNLLYPGQDYFTRYIWTYSAQTDSWTPQLTADDPRLVAGNWFGADQGHWFSLLSARRLAKDNAVITSAPPAGAITTGNEPAAEGVIGSAASISGNTVVHACTGEHVELCVWQGNTLAKRYPAQTPIHGTYILNGYILYGFNGPIRGITPNGQDVDLTISPSGFEQNGRLLYVNGELWVASSTYLDLNTPEERGYVLLRPWGSNQAIVVPADVGRDNLSVAVSGNNFVIATTEVVQGTLTVVTVPINSARMTLGCGVTQGSSSLIDLTGLYDDTGLDVEPEGAATPGTGTPPTSTNPLPAPTPAPSGTPQYFPGTAPVNTFPSTISQPAFSGDNLSGAPGSSYGSGVVTSPTPEPAPGAAPYESPYFDPNEDRGVQTFSPIAQGTTPTPETGTQTPTSSGIVPDGEEEAGGGGMSKWLLALGGIIILAAIFFIWRRIKDRNYEGYK